MVKRSYDVGVGQNDDIMVAGPTSDVYDNPTFNREDLDKENAEVDTPHVTTTDQSQHVKLRSQLKAMPMEAGDKLKLAFLIIFPLTLFIVAVIVTGLST